MTTAAAASVLHQDHHEYQHHPLNSGRAGGPSTSSSSPSSASASPSPIKSPNTVTAFAFKTPALPLKQRRVSLALPATPRVVEGWSFRDDTAVQATAAAGALGLGDKKKMQKVEGDAGFGLGEGSSASAKKATAGTATPEKPEKKARKKWTVEETAMLVAGCNKHGVGNWKTILRDPTLTFDNRSPVDLKDRFRTYYPDAYRQHYPNAKTHLSNKVRSTLPDGKPLFEKTRSKRRRPFTEEEDRALKEGYEKYGTVWATIVKEYPIFGEQGRRSTDLRDRFRNAFPELYSLAGYKPRNAAKKKMAAAAAAAAGSGEGNGFLAAAASASIAAASGSGAAGLSTMTRRAATDDQLGTTSTGGPVRSRRRAHTTQGMLRGGTKSVPQSTACTEDEDSSSEEPEMQLISGLSSPPPGFLTPGQLSSSGSSSPRKRSPEEAGENPYEMVQDELEEDEGMDMMTMDPLAEALSLPDILSSQSHYQHQHSHGWSSGVSTPTHSNHWSTAAGSPTSSHLSSDLLMGTSSSASPFLQHRLGAGMMNQGGNNNMGMIGKSAWGTDWFSPNPRLDPSMSSSSSASCLDSTSTHPHHQSARHNVHLHQQQQPSASTAVSPPSSPFSFNHLNHGVLDRYDLFPSSSMSEDFSSEVGVGDTHSAFSDEAFQPVGFRGFTHHSSYAGDLIFGARTHQPVQPGFSFNTSHAPSLVGGLGAGGFGFGSLGLTGLLPFASLQQQSQQEHAQGGGQGQSAGIHPMALHTASGGEGVGGQGGEKDPLGVPLPDESMDEDLEEGAMAMAVDGQQQHGRGSPVKTHQQDRRQQQLHHQQQHLQQGSILSDAGKGSLMTEPLSFDDLVDLSHDHEGGLGLGSLHGLNGNATPPATPSATLSSADAGHANDYHQQLHRNHQRSASGTSHAQPRPLRRSSGSILNQFPSPGSLHARSVSVPPSEFRNNGGDALANDGGASGGAGLLDLGGDGEELSGMVGMRHLNLRLGMFGPQPSISQQLEQVLGPPSSASSLMYSQDDLGLGLGYGSGGGGGSGGKVDGRGERTIGRRRGRGMVLSSPSSPMGVGQHRSLGVLEIEAFISSVSGGNLTANATQGNGAGAGGDTSGNGNGSGANGAEGEEDDDDDSEDPRPQTPTLASSRGLLMSLPNNSNVAGGAAASGGSDVSGLGLNLSPPRGIAPSISTSSTASQHSSASSSSVTSGSSSSRSEQLSPVTTDDGWRAPVFGSHQLDSSQGQFHQQHQQQHNLGLGSSSADLYGLPFLDLHYYGGGSGGMGSGPGHGGMMQHHGSVSLGEADEFGFAGMSDGSSGTGALDLARTVQGASYGNGFTGKGMNYFGHSSSQQHGGGGFMDFSENSHQPQQGFGGGGAGMFKTGPGLGRSHSHHRGQSHSVMSVVGQGAGVDPRELMMHGSGEGSKKKRASWDGRRV